MLRDAVPLGECGRALVVKLRHHGDVLLAAPVLTTLKSHAPKLEVDALLYDDTAPMFEGHPALSELHVVGRNWKALGAMERFSREMELFGRLRARRYDLLVHLSEQPRGAWLARTLGARYSVAPAMPGRGRFWAKSFTHLYPVVGAAAGTRSSSTSTRCAASASSLRLTTARWFSFPGNRPKPESRGWLPRASSICIRPRAGPSNAGRRRRTPS